MKLSKETLDMLKFASLINRNLEIRPGSVISTINAANNVIADLRVPDEFDTTFGIYDLVEFLGAYSLMGEAAEVEFGTQSAKLSDGKSTIRYHAAGEGTLHIPTKKIKFPESDITFTIAASQLSAIVKTSSVLRAPDVVIKGDGKKIDIVLCEFKNSSTNNYTLESVGTTDKEFNAVIRVENLKLASGLDYTVDISSKKIMRWVSTDESVTVYNALETTSTF